MIRDEVIFEKLMDRWSAEISTLWQRSLYLWGIDLLLFTGYGKYISRVIDKNGSFFAISADSLKLLSLEYGDQSYLSCLPIVLSILGISVSLVWVAMAKGSKANQEYIEHELDIVLPGFKQYMEQHICLDLDKNVFSLKGGPFSVGKINILMPLCSLVLWCVALIFQIVMMFQVYRYVMLLICVLPILLFLSIFKIKIVQSVYLNRARIGHLIKVRKIRRDLEKQKGLSRRFKHKFRIKP